MRTPVSVTRRVALILAFAFMGPLISAVPAIASPAADRPDGREVLAIGYRATNEEFISAVEKIAEERSGILNRELASDPRYAKGVAVATVARTTIRDNPALLSRQKAADSTITGCFWIQHNQYGVNNVGSYIWRFSMRIDWCYDGYRVTSISPPQISGYVYGWASAAGWEYDGITSQAQWDYYGDGWVYRSTANGKFSFCPPPKLWCLQRVYPWIRIDTYGNGSYDHTGGS